MLSSFIIIILGALGVALGPQESFGFSISFTIYAISRFLIASGTRGINDTGYILGMCIEKQVQEISDKYYISL